MIKCPKCGEELEDSTIHCTYCGELVGEEPKPVVIIDEKAVKNAYFEGMVDAFKFIKFIHIPYKKENHTLKYLFSSEPKKNRTFDEKLFISAIEHENKDIIKAMFNAGFHPLHTAAKEGNEDLLNALLKMGFADIDQVDEEENTALMLAAERGNNKILKILMNAGANVNKTNIYNESAVDLARRHSNSYTVGILNKAGAVEKSDNT